MEDIISSPASPNALKRAAPEDETPKDKLLNLKGNQFMMPTPPETDQSSNASPEDNLNKNRTASPAPSSSALSTIESVSNAAPPESTLGPAAAAAASASGTAPPPAKRRKLTPAEKLEQQQAREAKEREKAVNRARKDEEKRIKDEEKRKKAEEREAKKREKDLEEERKAQEKLKKERSQMRLGAFFQARSSATSPRPGESDATPLGRRARSRSLSLEQFDAVAGEIRGSLSPSRGPKTGTPQRASEKKHTSAVKPVVLSDYRKAFLPFQLPSHSKLASAPLQQRTLDEIEAAQVVFDSEINDPSHREKYDLGLCNAYVGLDQYFSNERKLVRGVQSNSMRQLVDQIQGTSSQPIDLTDDASNTDPLQCLQQVSVRHLHFYEDVRPAYCGTFTKIRSPTQAAKLRRNPFSRVRTDTDYEYDSEAEWEEPEEGEDLLSDDEEEADDPADADDIDGFLDDEDDTMKTKRKMITGDLIPTNTGICWEDMNGRVIPNDAETLGRNDLNGMRMDVLLAGLHGKTIDPFSTEYWEVPEPVPTTNNNPTKDTNSTNPTGSMAPPRPPLQQRLNTNATIESTLIGAAEGEKGPIMSVAGPQGAKRGRKPAPKTLSTEDLEEFKEAVVGSTLGKLDLVKGLKTRFPKITQDVIKDTLGSHFAQIGNSRADKKWVFVIAT